MTADAKKTDAGGRTCPILGKSCLQEGCAWWSGAEKSCAILPLAGLRKAMQAVQGQLRNIWPKLR